MEDPFIQTIRWTLIGFMLAGSAFFSACEAAYFSLDRVQLDRIHHKSGRIVEWLQYLISRPRQLLLTIISGNELTNFCIAMLTTELVHKALSPRGLDDWSALVNSFILTPLLIIFTEVAPKIIGLSRNERYSHLFAPVLFFFFHVIRPLRAVLYFLVRTILKALGIPTERFNPLTEDEFMTMIAESQKAGHLDDKDQEFIQNVFDFTDHTGIEVMKPLKDCLMLPTNLFIEEAIRVLWEEGYSRAPVYDESRETIVGVVYARDLLRVRAFYSDSSNEMRLKYIMRPAHFVKSHWSVNKILREMKRHRRQIVIVYTEGTGTQSRKTALGILTMEDLIEELFGKIEDEKDVQKGEDS